MGMNDIELLGLRTHGLLLHENERRLTIDGPAFQSKGMGTGRPEAGRCLRISTGKECDVMALANEFFSDIGDNPFCTSVQPGRYAFPKRSDLCDFHAGLSFPCCM